MFTQQSQSSVLHTQNQDKLIRTVASSEKESYQS